MRAKDVGTAALISPDIKVYELTTGGVRELRDDWCFNGERECAGSNPQTLTG